MDAVEVIVVITSLVTTIAPVYYKLGKLEQEVKTLKSMVEVKARWK
jgi:hypothetical protein